MTSMMLLAMKKYVFVLLCLASFGAGCVATPCSDRFLTKIQVPEAVVVTPPRFMDTHILTQADFNGSGLSKERDLIHAQGDAFRVRINPDVPVYTFRVVAYSTSTGAHGYIDIFRGEGTEPSVQMIPLDPNAFSADEVARYFNVQDINFDGFLDIGVLVDGGAMWGAYQYWVFDPMTGVFVTSPATKDFRHINFNEIEFDVGHKQLVTKNLLGAVGGVRSVYQFEKGRWTMIDEETRENRLRDEMQSSSTPPVVDCVTTHKTYVGKKPQTTTQVVHHECDAKGKGYF